MDKEAVLISIQPKWCELIANGKKTIEVRKTKPKLKPPFKCYIYCTKARPYLVVGDVFRGDWHTEYTLLGGYGRKEAEEKWTIFNGGVIGEFICNDIETLPPNTVFNAPVLFEQSCLTSKEYWDYIGDCTAYIWHISDLTIYSRPKALSEFRKPCICPEMPYCPTCPVGYEYISETEEEFYRVDGECNTEWRCLNFLKKAPQSWCYVEGYYENA